MADTNFARVLRLADAHMDAASAAYDRGDHDRAIELASKAHQLDSAAAAIGQHSVSQRATA